MQRYARLYAELDASASTTRKLAALRDYFAQAPAEDAAWGLYFLLGNRLKRLIPPTRLRQYLVDYTQLPAAVIEEAYAHVGDLAETIALLADTLRTAPVGPAAGSQRGTPPPLLPQTIPSLADCVDPLLSLASADEPTQRAAVIHRWQTLPPLECLLFNKLLTGALRVGVSQGLAARALAEHAGLDVNLVQSRLMGEWRPGPRAWAELLAPATSSARDPSQPYPFCLASPLDGEPDPLGPVADYLAEWKWDGIRGQLIRREGRTWLWSRGEELLNGRFPEIESAAARLPEGSVLDGEILAWHPERGVLPFATLQKRIGRKAPGRKTLAEAPVRFLAYDLLEHQGLDCRDQPLQRRRQWLEDLARASGLDVSSALTATHWSDLAQQRHGARERGVEGLMLKRLDSPYLGGRKRGAWWKWKVGALTVDTVLIYAQAGHGRRSNLYTDYTLAVWDGDQLVPVAKAYSGLTDAELIEMDRWIRAHTREKFGPVRSVEAAQVFEIAFEGIQPSPRHKAGVALRFPRIARWRRDKPAREADSLAVLKTLLSKP